MIVCTEKNRLCVLVGEGEKNYLGVGKI